MDDIRVIVFDDNQTIRESIELLINGAGGMTCVGSFANALHVEDVIHTTTPDVVLMDIDMPGRSGIEAVALIRKRFPDLQVIMVTVFDDDDKVFPALRSGANGYLLKNIRPEKIIGAIRDVLDGGAAFTPSIAKRVLQHFQNHRSQPTNTYDLTDREKEVLHYLIEGNNCRQIAKELFISYQTVRSHLKNIYRKMHVTSMSEAVSKTLRERLLD